MTSNHIIIVLAAIFLFAISLNVIHFHSFGGGASHHIDPLHETYVISLDDDDANQNGNEETPEVKQETNANASYHDETNVFIQIMNRSIHFQHQCNSLPEHHLGDAKPKTFDTGVPPLPEHGVHKAMKQWLDQENTTGPDGRRDYPMCSLPPTKECSVEQFTIILMSHTVDDDERLKKLRHGISNLASWKNTGEIILVWNNKRSVLEECTKEECDRINTWNSEKDHKLRIFWALEQGMGNNLLNRYHPSIQPQHEAIVYFDDDGPFHREISMDVGFELWKYNADVQIGSMARNIRFPSTRMDDLQNKASDLAANLYQEDRWETHVHPYDTATINEKVHEEDAEYPKFTPICHDQTGDVVQYNYYVFPHWKAHMTLPSGSILHRNYLCFVWHPAFEELREYILNHPTHPDDMTISTLVSHLTGKPLRTFPRNVKNDGTWRNDQRRRLDESSQQEIEEEDAVADAFENDGNYVSELMPIDDDEWRKDLEDAVVDDVENDGNYDSEIMSIGNGVQSHRRLLWQQQDWGNMREEAIGSLVGYFGSINPGSVGWCAGTEYQEPANGKGNMRFKCLNDKMPEVSKIPWMNKGNPAYDECH